MVIALAHADAVIARERFKTAVAQNTDATVPGMEKVCGSGLEDQPGKRAHHGALGLILPLALRIEPAVDRLEDDPDGLLHAPGGMRAVVVLQEALDRTLARLLGAFARRHAVGNRHGDAMGGDKRWTRDHDAIGIVITFLAAGNRILANAYSRRLCSCPRVRIDVCHISKVIS